MSPEKEIIVPTTFTPRDPRSVSTAWMMGICVSILLVLGGFFLTDTRMTVNGKLDRAEYVKDYQRRNEDIASIKAEIASMQTKLDGIQDLKQMMRDHLERGNYYPTMKSKQELRKDLWGK